MFSAHLRNDAETAWVITTFGNFYVCRMRRRQSKTWSVVIRNIGWPRVGEAKINIFSGQHSFDDRSEFPHFIQADEGIDFRHLFAQLMRETLRHTTAHD